MESASRMAMAACLDSTDQTGFGGAYSKALDKDIAEDRRKKGLAIEDARIATNLPQYMGKRVEYRELKNGNVEVTVNDSRLKMLGRSVVLKKHFDDRPSESNAKEVAWACEKVGVKM